MEEKINLHSNKKLYLDDISGKAFGIYNAIKRKGLISLAACISILIFNIHAFSSYSSEISNTLTKRKYRRRSVLSEIIIIVLSFIPMLVLWEILRGIIGSWF